MVKYHAAIRVHLLKEYILTWKYARTGKGTAACDKRTSTASGRRPVGYFSYFPIFCNDLALLFFFFLTIQIHFNVTSQSGSSGLYYF